MKSFGSLFKGLIKVCIFVIPTSIVTLSCGRTVQQLIIQNKVKPSSDKSASDANKGTSVSVGGNAANNPSASIGEGGFQFTGDANLKPRLRLKSNAEIFGTLQGVFGYEVTNQKALPTESLQLQSGFSNDSSAHQLGEAYYIATQRLASAASKAVTEATLTKFCIGGNASGVNCARAFITNYGRAMMARNLKPDEITSLLNVYTAAAAVDGEKPALRSVMEVMLQLPSFLYRTELGDPAAKQASSRLTAPELATALSSFFWEAPPDEILLKAAESGSLQDAILLRKQAERLARHPKARPAMSRFVFQWLDIRNIESQNRDPKEFLGFSPAVVAAMQTETKLFAENVIFDKDSSLKTLLNAKFTYLNKTLTDFYGYGGATKNTFDESALPALKSGILSQGSFMLAHSGESQSSPIKRGSFVRRNLLCNTIQPAPANAPTTVEPASKGMTVQSIFAQHKAAGCAGCHQLMNPIGFGFEDIDVVGRTRTLYNGLPIDSSGDLRNMTTGKSRPFATGGGIYAALSELPEVADCFVLRAYQYGLGRIAGTQDNETLEGLSGRFRASNFKILDLMIEIATSPAFVTRNTL